jgi:hypothetical protein
MTALLLGFLILFMRSSLSWPVRLAVVVAAWIFATYQIGLLSWDAIERMIGRLADQPGVDVFPPPPPGAFDASLVLSFALLLTPVLGLVLLVVIWAWSAFVEDLLLSPFGIKRLVPDWLLMVPFVGVVSVVAYAAESVWLPWCLWVLGVIARAYQLALG